MIRPPVEGLVPVFLFAAADFIKHGRVDFRVLKDPRVSMSSTVLKALEERAEMGEMKFPAAPALGFISSSVFIYSSGGYPHHEIYPSQLFHTARNGRIQVLYLPHIYGPDPYYFRSFPSSRYVFRH